MDTSLYYVYHQSHSHVVGDSKLQEPSTVKQSEPDISAGWIISLLNSLSLSTLK